MGSVYPAKNTHIKGDKNSKNNIMCLSFTLAKLANLDSLKIMSPWFAGIGNPGDVFSNFAVIFQMTSSSRQVLMCQVT